jgi:HSP20 family protein
MLPVIRNSRRNNENSSWLPSIFDDFFGDEFMGVPVSRQFATPAVNIIENDKQYDIQIAAPGMTKDDFKISINDNNELVINLEKKQKEEKKDDDKRTWLRREFSYASYSQSFVLPEDVKEESINAKMENGVLNIVLPKKEEAEQKPATRQIEIL